MYVLSTVALLYLAMWTVQIVVRLKKRSVSNMIYLYKKDDELLYFKRKLENSEVAMNKLEYQGKVTEEYYNSLIQVVSAMWHILKDSIERQLKERE